jgi:hypothetical protein
MPGYAVTVFLNTAPLSFLGLQPSDPVATDSDPTLTVVAGDPLAAAEQAFSIGNHMAADEDGRRWPTDVRSVSVGDLVGVRGPELARVWFFAVAGVGFVPVPEPTNPIAALAGSTATSRRADPPAAARELRTGRRGRTPPLRHAAASTPSSMDCTAFQGSTTLARTRSIASPNAAVVAAVRRTQHIRPGSAIHPASH